VTPITADHGRSWGGSKDPSKPLFNISIWYRKRVGTLLEGFIIATLINSPCLGARFMGIGAYLYCSDNQS
jgi:hypothetical protein